MSSNRSNRFSVQASREFNIPTLDVFWNTSIEQDLSKNCICAHARAWSMRWPLFLLLNALGFLSSSIFWWAWGEEEVTWIICNSFGTLIAVVHIFHVGFFSKFQNLFRENWNCLLKQLGYSSALHCLVQIMACTRQTIWVKRKRNNESNDSSFVMRKHQALLIDHDSSSEAILT